MYWSSYFVAKLEMLHGKDTMAERFEWPVSIERSPNIALYVALFFRVDAEARTAAFRQSD